MKRKIYNKLLDWKNQWQGKAAVLIDGARRVGKSWIAEEFAKNEYKSYILIDFNNVASSIKEVFELYTTDLDTFFSRLSLFTGVKLYERESLIIFDEIQMYPKARAAIKYLVKDGRYDYIETGSLVSINQNVRDIVIPSEEIRLNMYPMDLEEFMWAIDKKMLYDFARDQFHDLNPMGQILHRQMMEVLRAYLLVGGMPQAVQSYIDNKDFRTVEAIKRNILSLYRNDITKYAGRQAPKVTIVFDNIPGQLQRHEKRFKPSSLKKNSRMRDFAEAFFWLAESRVANFCYATTEPSVGLSLNKDEAKVKIYLADTGLLVSMAFSENMLESGGLYEKILTGKLEFNKGMLIENLVAQMLTASDHPLYFYSKNSRTDAAERMEIDFLIAKETISNRHNIHAIEVKSTSRYTFDSLEKFENKFKSYLSTPYLLHTGDVETKNGVVCLPIYMAPLL